MMRLLPNMLINGVELSLQAPFTANTGLIYKMNLYDNYIEFTAYDFIDRRNKIFDVSIEAIRSFFNNNVTGLHSFIVNDDTGEYRNSMVTVTDYINDVRRQVITLDNHTTLIEALIRLKKQLRMSSYISYSIPDDFGRSDRLVEYHTEALAPSVLNEGVNSSSVNSIERLYSYIVDEEYARPNLLGNIYVSSATTMHNTPSESTYIHAWNYKPEYIAHTLPDESSPLLLGAEIEVDNNKNESVSRDEIVKKCIQIMNGSDSVEEDLLYSTKDSSVQIELDTMPCSLEFHKTMNYREMFKYLSKAGYKGHDGRNAGLHIHASRSYLGDSVLKQQLVISKILYILEKFNDEICVLARRNKEFSAFAGNGKDEDTVVELYAKYKTKGKHVALNLQHKDTIEFRCFKSTLKPETFLLTLEFVQDIIDYAKKINIEDIELIKWEDIMEQFSDELRNYYEERRKKNNKVFQNPIMNWIERNIRLG